MSTLLASLNLSTAAWVFLGLGGLIIGFSKAGFGGAGIIVLPIFAALFGGKEASGIMLPILTFGDVLGLLYFHRNADFKKFTKLIPWTLLGIGIGLLIGRYVDDLTFKRLIGISVLIGIGFMAWREYLGRDIDAAKNPWFGIVVGIAGGVITMIANAGGTIIGLYFLSLRLPKNTYIGTTIWFVFLINVLKIPFQILFWGNITLQTLSLDLALVPAVIIGFFLGLFLIRRIQEKKFRLVIMALSAAASIKLLF